MIGIALYGLCIHNVQAQLPLMPAMSPAIADLANAAASTALAGVYGGAVLTTQSLLNSEIKNFRKQWDNRGTYLGGEVFERSHIYPKLDDFESRLSELEEENMNLSAFVYSKKDENTKLLLVVREEFDILNSEIKDRSHLVVVLGEKINLYQNMMRTITRLNRQLDVVEGNIGGSNAKEKLVDAMKNRTNIQTN